MLIEWITPVLTWLGIGIIPFLLIILIIVIILRS